MSTTVDLRHHVRDESRFWEAHYALAALEAKYASLSGYDLAALFHEVATEKCTSWEQDVERQIELEQIAAVMDLRGVRLEDWDLRSYR
jgi:hypothetical protein